MCPPQGPETPPRRFPKWTSGTSFRADQNPWCDVVSLLISVPRTIGALSFRLGGEETPGPTPKAPSFKWERTTWFWWRWDPVKTGLDHISPGCTGVKAGTAQDLSLCLTQRGRGNLFQASWLQLATTSSKLNPYSPPSAMRGQGQPTYLTVRRKIQPALVKDSKIVVDLIITHFFLFRI